LSCNNNRLHSRVRESGPMAHSLLSIQTTGMAASAGGRRNDGHGEECEENVMEKEIESVSGRIRTFGQVVSVAFQQARQSEIDVLSKRSIRERYESGDGSPAHLRDTRSHDELPTTQGNGGLRTIWRCCSEANRQAMQSEIDVLARRRFRESREAGGPGGDSSALEGDAGTPRETRTPQEGKRGRSLPNTGQLEGSLPDCS